MTRSVKKSGAFKVAINIPLSISIEIDYEYGQTMNIKCHHCPFKSNNICILFKEHINDGKVCQSCEQVYYSNH